MDDVRVVGEPLALPIYWAGRQWAVTSRGIEKRDGTYPIAASRLWEEDNGYGWVAHLAEKEWCDQEEFGQALDRARKQFANLQPKP